MLNIVKKRKLTGPLEESLDSLSGEEEDFILNEIIDELREPFPSSRPVKRNKRQKRSPVVVFPLHNLQQSGEIEEDDLDEEDHNEDDDNSDDVLTRHRNYHVNNISKIKKIIRIPRILHSDIRRKYPTMFMNMINSCDLSFMELFFLNYSSQVSALTWNHGGMNDGPMTTIDSMGNQFQLLKRTMNFQAVFECASFLFLTGLTIPDRVFEFKNADVISRSNSFQTTIVIDWVMKGNRFYRSNPIHVGMVVQQLRNLSYFTGKAETAESRRLAAPGEETDANNYERTLQNLFYGLAPCLPRPHCLECHGKFTLIINDYRESLKIDEIIVDVLETNFDYHSELYSFDEQFFSLIST